MPIPRRVELGPDEAAGLLDRDVTQASDLLESGRVDEALDRYVAALGLALQLGPAAIQKALTSSLDGAQQLASLGDAGALCAMGPALVGLVSQVLDAEVLDNTPVSNAWSMVAIDTGSLIGQVGLALGLPSRHRDGMMQNAHERAALLDDATGGVLRIVPWLDSIQDAARDGRHSHPGT